MGTVDGPYVVGDATDEQVLRAAGIDRARVLITALNTDADNLYVTLTARSMGPDLFIVSRAAPERRWPSCSMRAPTGSSTRRISGAPGWPRLRSNPTWPSSWTW